jgi:hypothetical protein
MTHRLLPLSPLRRASGIWDAAFARWGGGVAPLLFANWATPSLVARLARVPSARAISALVETFAFEHERSQRREAQPHALTRTPVFRLVRSSMQEPRVYSDAAGRPLACGDLVRVVNSDACFVVLGFEEVVDQHGRRCLAERDAGGVALWQDVTSPAPTEAETTVTSAAAAGRARLFPLDGDWLRGVLLTRKDVL